MNTKDGFEVYSSVTIDRPSCFLMNPERIISSGKGIWFQTFIVFRITWMLENGYSAMSDRRLCVSANDGLRDQIIL